MRFYFTICMYIYAPIYLYIFTYIYSISICIDSATWSHAPRRDSECPYFMYLRFYLPYNIFPFYHLVFIFSLGNNEKITFFLAHDICMNTLYTYIYTNFNGNYCRHVSLFSFLYYTIFLSVFWNNYVSLCTVYNETKRYKNIDKFVQAYTSECFHFLFSFGQIIPERW